jgi:hypothetical protein
MDEIGEVLKVVGALVAILVGFTTLSTYLRRSERIRVDSSTVFSDSSGTVEITVTNLGGNDITLTEMGFAVVNPSSFTPILRMFLFPVYKWILRKQCSAGRRYSDLGEEDDVQLVVPLKPSQPYTRKIPMDYIAGWLGTGEVAWPYAKDTIGRERYSARPADVYVWVGDGWRLV